MAKSHAGTRWVPAVAVSGKGCYPEKGNLALLITINGRQQELEGVSSPATLAVVLESLKMRGDRVAAELNGELAPRTRWEQIEVRSGDRLEVVHFVGGGHPGEHHDQPQAAVTRRSNRERTASSRRSIPSS